MVTIERDSAYADKIRNYKVVLDNRVIGEIADGQTQSFDVKAGVHTLCLKIDWARSNEVEFEISDKEVVRFKCVSSLRGENALLAIFYATFLFWRTSSLNA